MDIRLKKVPFEWSGKVYNLCCNMNVLADVQEAFDGDLNAALGKSSMRGILEFLAAMLNDAADTVGAKERFTAKEIGRKLPLSRRGEVQELVMDLFTASCAPAEDDAEADGTEKNVPTSQSEAGSTLSGT